MSFLFRAETHEEGSSHNQFCPGCQAQTGNATDVEQQCANCSMWFQRITVLEKDNTPTQLTQTPRMNHRSCELRIQDVSRSKVRDRRKRCSQVVEVEDMRDFKRIRLVATKRLTDAEVEIDTRFSERPNVRTRRQKKLVLCLISILHHGTRRSLTRQTQ